MAQNEASGRDAKYPDRGSLAEDRTVLAAERTFAAWLRTGLAFLSVGLAAQRFLTDVLPFWQLRVLAFTLVLCAIACFAAAAWRDGKVRQSLPQADIRLLPFVATLGVSLLLIAVSVMAGFALWLR